MPLSGVPLVAGKLLPERINNQMRRRQISLVRMILDVELGNVEHLARLHPRRQTIQSCGNQRVCHTVDVPKTRSPLVGTVAGARVISVTAVCEQLAPVNDLRLAWPPTSRPEKTNAIRTVRIIARIPLRLDRSRFANLLAARQGLQCHSCERDGAVKLS